MKVGLRFVRALFAAVVVLCVAQPALAQQNRGHVYLLRGLANVFSLGDVLIAVGAAVFLVRQMRTAAPNTGHPATPVRPVAG